MQFIGCFQTLARGDPCVGIHGAENLEWGSFDVMDYIASTSRDIREAIPAFLRFVPIMISSAEWVVHPSGEALWVERRPTGAEPASRHAAEFALGCVILRSSWVTTTRWLPREVAFRSPAPADPGEYHRVLGCPVTFDAGRDGFAVGQETLDIPMKSFDTALNAIVERQATKMLNAYPGEGSLLGEVKSEIRREFHGTRPQVERVAKALGMSGRSLQRNLLAMGTSYQEVLREEGLALAKTYLESTRMSVAEIAFILGYSEVSAFQRAFGKGAGLSPRAFRGR